MCLCVWVFVGICICANLGIYVIVYITNVHVWGHCPGQEVVPWHYPWLCIKKRIDFDHKSISEELKMDVVLFDFKWHHTINNY